MEHSSQQQPKLGAFHVTCWIMGLVAFIQLMSVGAAMAFRTSAKSPPEVVTKVVTQYVPIESKQPIKATPPTPQVERLTYAELLELVPTPDLGPVVEPEVLKSAPFIDDPIIETLVKDARAARIGGDPVTAMMKLEEAKLEEPKNPNILYETAVTYEALGVYDKAADYYVEVKTLGPLKAGALWKKAAMKLEKGIVTDTKGLASFGAARRMEPELTAEGERRSVWLSISVAPGREFDSNLLEPRVQFFEENDGELMIALTHEGARGDIWSKPVNWEDGEEMVEVWYRVPREDVSERRFHGFIAELYYDGKLLDMAVQPGTLHSEMRAQKATSDTWDPDIDPYLEALDNHGAGDSLLPQLPSKK